MSKTLVVATRNKHKKKELQDLLGPRGWTVRSLDDERSGVDVDETGSTFPENARLKATEQALALKKWTLGEDSGLEVEALNGAPGVYSARFAGAHGNDEANNDLLLAKLEGIPPEKRGARYVCAAAVSDRQGNVVAEAVGFCRGRILTERRGSAGFGYDPLFLIREYGRTFAELGDEVKAVLSHRTRAMERLLPMLEKLAAEGRFAD
ncbi:MAG TPA: RdgB/HAM1 family non-canonical purine NTP pyrophosphatase [Pirellulaceae bacterium]|jgi:XTP/dITP diphosphohydrolase|nr:RdgB/HAM1 family non-canonical purine NTP pyrophosphatase [Pirellulaceae bacterium]